MRFALWVLVAASVLVAGCSHPPGTEFNPAPWPPLSPPPPPPVTPLRPTATPTPAPSPAATPVPPSPAPSPAATAPAGGDPAKGQTFFASSCTACHSAREPFASGKGTPIGPGLAGVSAKGEVYIRESIVEPSAKIAEGFSPIMPDSFDQQLCGKKASSAAEAAGCASLDDLVAYLLSL